MKVLIYVNPDKDKSGKILLDLTTALKNYNIEYCIIGLTDKNPSEKYSALFVIGGDGTILRRTEYANKNNIPIIGINGGKIGYLSEFEKNQAGEAVDLFVNNKLKKDERSTLLVSYNDKEIYALNDAVVQRVYLEENKSNIINVSFSIDNNKIDTITGDGIIVATPTGSTAYSLSAGGAILAPNINAFSITPISAHSLSQRPVIFSSSSTCQLSLESASKAGLFVDGKLVSLLDYKDKVTVVQTPKPTIFLRRENSNFYKKLSQKLSSRNMEKYD